LSSNHIYFSTTTAKVLITGATGAIGPSVVHALYQTGCRLRTFSVDESESGLFPPPVEVVIGDVADRAAVESAMQGMDAVVHMAALLHIVNPPPEMREKYERINIGGTETVVEVALVAGVKRLVLFSTIAVYGQADGQVLNEQSPTNPNTFYAETKLAAEKIVLNARGADGQPIGTVLRLGAVYGSHIKGNYRRLTRALARRRFIPIGNGLNHRTLVYDKDVGRAAVLAVFHPAAAGKVFNVTDGGSHTLNEIIESICLALGRKPPGLSLPAGPTRKVIGLIDKGSYAIGLKPPVTRDIIDKYTEDIDVDGSLIQKELSYMPQYDLKTGWKETIEEMRARGEL
jgi:nucleoside-diphosphate-sugar epimerase